MKIKNDFAKYTESLYFRAFKPKVFVKMSLLYITILERVLLIGAYGYILTSKKLKRFCMFIEFFIFIFNKHFTLNALFFKKFSRNFYFLF